MASKCWCWNIRDRDEWRAINRSRLTRNGRDEDGRQRAWGLEQTQGGLGTTSSNGYGSERLGLSCTILVLVSIHIPSPCTEIDENTYGIPLGAQNVNTI